MDVKELKKAMECCSNNDKCNECPLYPQLYCGEALAAEAEKYIAELEERLAITQESMEALEKRCKALEALEQRCKALKKRNEPMKPESIMTTSAGVPMSHCPNCNEPINQYRHPKYCGACGQAVKWA